MDQESMNLRLAAKIAVRSKVLIGIIVALGFIGGAGYAALLPPKLTSQAIVVIPMPKPGIATQALIAGSAPVLSGALPALGSTVTLQALQNEITATSVTPNAISIAATGKTADAAERAANAVAESFISYIGSNDSPVGKVVGRFLVRATTATGTSRSMNILTYGGISLLAGLFIGFLVAVRKERSDRHLRQRDQIARTAGVPVLAAVEVESPKDPDGWVRFFSNFDTTTGNTWQLRRVLDKIGIPDGGSTTGSMITVLFAAADKKASALGPKLAAFAGSSGIRTALVVGPQTPAGAGQALLDAASAGEQFGNVRIFAADPADKDWRQPGAGLTVVVLGMDGTAPVPSAAGGGTIVLAATAGEVTVEQLARTASAATIAGIRLSGVIVGNPAPDDTTTGLLVDAGRATGRSASARVNGVAMEIRR